MKIKRMLSYVVILALVTTICLFAVVQAESVPSISTGDMTDFEVKADNLPADAKIVVSTITPTEEKTEEMQKKIDLCNAEIEKLAQEDVSIEEYFGELTNEEGEPIVLSEILGLDEETEELNIHEFCPLTVSGYEEEYGQIGMELSFATVYPAGEKVIVMVGILKVDANGVQTIEWTVFEGIGTNAGSIEVEFTPEILLAAQEGTAMMAIVSK